MPHRLTPLAAALLLSMLAPVSSSALAAPAVAHWTVTDLGTLGGAYSYGYGINNAGSVQQRRYDRPRHPGRGE